MEQDKSNYIKLKTAGYNEYIYYDCENDKYCSWDRAGNKTVYEGMEEMPICFVVYNNVVYFAGEEGHMHQFRHFSRESNGYPEFLYPFTDGVFLSDALNNPDIKDIMWDCGLTGAVKSDKRLKDLVPPPHVSPVVMKSKKKYR